jgi:secreted Zn-dependent insulinase-like peptidase
LKQSPNDLKQYHPFTLNNGLRVLAIHNEDSEKSAAALAVNAGHFNDPKDRQGLAHFLEHMLFLGTEKYPDGSEYQKFISQHGGSNNAWTSTEHTCFYFDVHHQFFSDALDRFSNFFTSPLLSEDFINKERKNIDAEFKLKLKDDIRRLYDVHKETINQAHPFSQFSVGNIETLEDRDGKTITSEVKAFFDTYYQAKRMTLVVEGPQPIKELIHLAESMFDEIKTINDPLTEITEPLYFPEHQGIKIDICPVKDDRQLIISFAMESIDKYYRDKPESILAYLLGHEGPGSILAKLKHEQWGMGLTAGSGINGSNFKDFNIRISLTEEGENHLDEVIGIVFSYIGLLNSKTFPEHYYHEKQAIAELSFIYHEKSKPLDNVSQLVINMQHYPVNDYIFGDYIMSGMDQGNISHLLSYLNVDNLRVTHVSHNNAFSKTSRWYDVPYDVNTIPKSTLKKWRYHSSSNNESANKYGLFLPDANSYIIGNPKVYDTKSSLEMPEKIVEQSGLTIWYKQDATFKVPKGYIYLGIDSPYSIESVENIAMTRLFVDLYTNTVVEENYDAELAGIHYHLYAHQGGITLHISGISENQSTLLQKLLFRLQAHEINLQDFDLFKQQLISHWANTDKSKSISQLFSTLSSISQPNNPNAESLANALNNITLSQYKTFCKRLFKEVTLEALIHGNWLLEHAESIAIHIEKAFNNQYNSKHEVQGPVIDFSGEHTLLLPMTIPEHDHATVVYTPLPTRNDDQVALAMVTSHLLSPFFFQEMRTEKQYGYIVGVGYVPVNRYPGIAFYIQSPHTDGISLTKAIDAFIADSENMLDSITEENWHHVIQGLTGQLEEKDSNLRIKSQRFWAAICNKDHIFSHKEQLLGAIKNIDLIQIKTFISKQLMASVNPDRLILSSTPSEFDIKQLPISQHNNEEIITNNADFITKSKRKY